MISHTFRQFAFTIVITYAIAVDISNGHKKKKLQLIREDAIFDRTGSCRASGEDDYDSIFLRIYIGTTMDEYADYPLGNASAITSRIDNSKPTVLYIHGYTEHLEKESVQTVVEAYLKRNDHNVIAVDYGKLASNSYLIVTMSAPRIADAVATALDEMKNSGFNTEKLHIVSHSMGSQISGYIGRKVSFQIPRITGLDPAGPLFHLLQPSLSSSDARFVDIIHTDSGFYGISKTTGTVDFFPNGGTRIQPGCPPRPKFFSEEDFCSHHRSWRFYAESLTDESTFLGVHCPSLSDFTYGECNNNTRTVMGYATPTSVQGTVYLTTKDESPFGLDEKGIMSTN